MKPLDVSVVIIARNEQSSIDSAIRSAIEAGAVEVIVCDGGSQDQTIARATSAGATKVIRSVPGRGIQLNAGAMFAKGEFVLFLHADNQLGEHCLQQICDCGDVVWGAFRQDIDAKGRKYRWLEKGNALRVRWFKMAFGDQAIFVNRSAFKKNGGFDEIPLMEDLEFSRRMREIATPVLLPGPVRISPRRWQQHGVIRQTLHNWSLQLAHKLGVPSSRLANWYR
ncbi:TIGR04283 family arsenosugar biosynthesis glycosyltransferase [Novipirellula artificiosorum]|uniref:Glycosyl transferase family 2 n=1 Tax=Novipirellula artificiosorum TaxID=2528016 RepID=A0A5C6E2J2_9BACT|nr:TIGR04283 family arsenosugar biosynthesis glycosyltransferase [Novipirellula artificiosorum]TWU41831.1 Glycosyl transferase family 2 [Novipirellula artificiosorum]